MEVHADCWVMPSQWCLIRHPNSQCIPKRRVEFDLLPAPSLAFPHKSTKLSFPFQWLSDFGRVLQGNPRGRGLLLFVADPTVTFLTCWMDFRGIFFLFYPLVLLVFAKGQPAFSLSFLENVFFPSFPIFYLLLRSSSFARNSETVAFARLIAFHGSSPQKKRQNKMQLRARCVVCSSRIRTWKALFLFAHPFFIIIIEKRQSRRYRGEQEAKLHFIKTGRWREHLFA